MHTHSPHPKWHGRTRSRCCKPDESQTTRSALSCEITCGTGCDASANAQPKLMSLVDEDTHRLWPPRIQPGCLQLPATQTAVDRILRDTIDEILRGTDFARETHLQRQLRRASHSTNGRLWPRGVQRMSAATAIASQHRRCIVNEALANGFQTNNAVARAADASKTECN
jgi:hypothetical protein